MYYLHTLPYETPFVLEAFFLFKICVLFTLYND